VYDVLDSDDRHSASPDSGNFFDQGTTFWLSQTTGNLVQKENSRVGSESSCQLQALAIQERQAAGSDVCLGQETSFFQNFNAAMVYLAFGLSVSKSRANQEIFENGHSGERMRDLERTRDTATAPFECSQMRDIATLKEYLALVGFGDPGEDIKHRRFAGAVWTNHAKGFSFVEMHAQMIVSQQ
jgi:photosystem II stability/assembly factor-like uncharacterized protein